MSDADDAKRSRAALQKLKLLRLSLLQAEHQCTHSANVFPPEIIKVRLILFGAEMAAIQHILYQAAEGIHHDVRVPQRLDRLNRVEKMVQRLFDQCGVQLRPYKRASVERVLADLPARLQLAHEVYAAGPNNNPYYYLLRSILGREEEFFEKLVYLRMHQGGVVIAGDFDALYVELEDAFAELSFILEGCCGI